MHFPHKFQKLLSTELIQLSEKRCMYTVPTSQSRVLRMSANAHALSFIPIYPLTRQIPLSSNGNQQYQPLLYHLLYASLSRQLSYIIEKCNTLYPQPYIYHALLNLSPLQTFNSCIIFLMESTSFLCLCLVFFPIVSSQQNNTLRCCYLTSSPFVQEDTFQVSFYLIHIHFHPNS